MREETTASPARAREDVGSSRERIALWMVLLFTLGGGAVAGYLVWLHAKIAGNPRKGLCTFTDTISCDKVLASPYAEIAGIPLGVIGFVGFALLFGLAAWRLFGRQCSPRALPAILTLTAGFGLAFEVVMTWVEFFVIEAVCPYCLTALACITASFVAAVVAWRGSRILSSVEARHA